MENPEIQKHFAQWLRNRDSNASKDTRKQEVRHLRRMAQHFPEMALLDAELEKQQIDMRNEVANKSVKVGVSRMIDEAFLKRMQAVIEQRSQITPTMENGFCVFSATLMTGLRPFEWWYAQRYEPHQNPHCPSPHPTLRVATGKRKPEQEQQYRDLVLEGFQQPHIAMVDAAIETVKGMTAVQHGYLSNGIRRLALHAANGPEEEELVANLELGSARKLYAVEALREGRSNRQVAGCLGHTSDNNLRHYSEGDIYRARMMRYPLAKITEQAELQVKEHLKSFLENRYGEQQTPTQTNT